MKQPIYLDHNATTPVDQRVLEAMLPYFSDIYGNAASIDHDYGYIAKRAVDVSRKQVADLINAQPEEIIFTSGATESDNLAIIGTVEKTSTQGNHIITCATEHKAVLDTCQYLRSKGFDITILPVDKYGIVNPDDVRNSIKPQTILISIMAANNEIGTLAPVTEIGQIAREFGIRFHTDAAQAAGHIPLDVDSMNIDLLSISGHKIYGPKGIGALFVRNRKPRIRVAEQMHGGGHERGMRSGTLNVPGIVGLGKALEIAGKEMENENKRLFQLREHLMSGLQTKIEGIELNGHPTKRLSHNLSIYIPGIQSKSLLVQLKEYLAISAGSACTTTEVKSSHVILALGFDEKRAGSTIRIGFGRYSTNEQVEDSINYLVSAIKKIGNIGITNPSN